MSNEKTSLMKADLKIFGFLQKGYEKDGTSASRLGEEILYALKPYDICFSREGRIFQSGENNPVSHYMAGGTAVDLEYTESKNNGVNVYNPRSIDIYSTRFGKHDLNSRQISFPILSREVFVLHCNSVFEINRGIALSNSRIDGLSCRSIMRVYDEEDLEYLRSRPDKLMGFCIPVTEFGRREPLVPIARFDLDIKRPFFKGPGETTITDLNNGVYQITNDSVAMMQLVDEHFQKSIGRFQANR